MAFPGDSTQIVRVEPITANRYPTVAILDVRLDKAFKVGRSTKITGMVDAFNLGNAGTVTAFRQTTASALFREVTGILDPRIFRFGLRVDF